MPNRTEILKVIADNPELFEAVKETVLSKFEFSVGNLPVGISVEELGRLTLSRMEGHSLVLDAFKEIERFRSRAERGATGENPAR